MPTESIAFYNHAGSGNHGCEAIVDSLALLLAENDAPSPVILMTNSAKEDETYRLGQRENLRIIEENHMDAHPVVHTLYYGYRALFRDRESFLRYRFKPLVGKKTPKLCVSIGGDNYCYPEMLSDLMLTDSMLKKQGATTVLLGCSIEPELLTGPSANPDLIKDLSSYRLITARETITYEALLAAGLSKEQVRLIPDPAFTMPMDPKVPLPEGFVMQLPFIIGEDGGAVRTPGTIGLNISPMAGSFAADKDVYMSAVKGLVRHILNTTEDSVLLIPHVIWERNDDRTVLDELYASFAEKDRARILRTPEGLSAEELKGLIAKCSLFIGSRTHATIAAYSSMVPTLVLGYSVKARGIARDLFGTDENYVLPVQNLTEESQLIDAFVWLNENADDIRKHLRKVMPDYIRRAEENGRAIMDVYREL